MNGNVVKGTLTNTADRYTHTHTQTHITMTWQIILQFIVNNNNNIA